MKRKFVAHCNPRDFAYTASRCRADIRFSDEPLKLLLLVKYFGICRTTPIGATGDIMRQLLNEVSPDQVDIHSILGFGFNTWKTSGTAAYRSNFSCTASIWFAFTQLCSAMGKIAKNLALHVRLLVPYARANLKKAGNLGFIAPSQAPLDQLLLFAPWLNQFPKAIIKNVPDSLPPLPEYTPSKEIRLAFAGRLASGKGIDFLLRVLDDLSSRFTFTIDILGTGPLELPLREQYKNKSWVAFHGFVSREQVACTIARADLVCMPSLWPETYGLVTAQALQIGTPVIGSNIGGTRYLVRHGKTGMLVAPGDKTAWTSTLSELIDEPSAIAKPTPGSVCTSEGLR